MADVIDDNNGGVGGGKVIDSVSKGYDIQGQQQRLLRRGSGHVKLATKTQASAEEYKLEISTTTIDASVEEL